MPSKRQPISFPELEPKGRGAILRSAEEVAAEEQLLETQEAGMPESQHFNIPDTQKAGIPESQLSGSQEIQDGGNRADYPKATYRLSPETLDAIDDAKRILRRQHGIKVTLEEIAEEAIQAAYRDLLDHQEASILASKFSGKPGRQKARK